MKMLLAVFLKIPHNVIEIMVVLMVLLLALKLVQTSVHHTCGGSHDIVCTLSSSFCWARGRGLNLLPNFLKRGCGLTGFQILEGVCLEGDRGDLEG